MTHQPVDWDDNPYRLWSLYDMIHKYGRALANISTLLSTLAMLEHHGASVASDDKQMRLLLGVLENNLSTLLELQLDLSHMYAQRVIEKWKTDGIQPVFKTGMIRCLFERVSDELNAVYFMHMNKANAALYNDTMPFGQEVQDKFPSCSYDVNEAAKCLATRRSTACVFHLMRVMEAGLKAAAKALGIPYAPSWESYLKQINDKVAVKHKLKGVKWKQDEPFFKDVAASLGTVKVAWRNPTMHIVRRYNEEEAREVYDSVRMFMRHLTSRLSEL